MLKNTVVAARLASIYFAREPESSCFRLPQGSVPTTYGVVMPPPEAAPAAAMMAPKNRA
jgi:hypothetical protein